MDHAVELSLKFPTLMDLVQRNNASVSSGVLLGPVIGNDEVTPPDFRMRADQLATNLVSDEVDPGISSLVDDEVRNVEFGKSSLVDDEIQGNVNVLNDEQSLLGKINILEDEKITPLTVCEEG